VKIKIKTDALVIKKEDLVFSGMIFLFFGGLTVFSHYEFGVNWIYVGFMLDLLR